MSLNMGIVDRVLRAAIGIAAAAIVAFGLVASPWTWVLTGVAVIMLATAAIGFCPLYSLLGANTNRPLQAGKHV